MIPLIIPQALGQDEIEQIHSTMLMILARTGVEVGHQEVREAYASYGARVDHQTGRVWIPERVVERFLAETVRTDSSSVEPSASQSSRFRRFFHPDCVPGGRPKVRISCEAEPDYVEPGTNRVIPLTEQALADHVKLGLSLGIPVGLGTSAMVALSESPVRPTIVLESYLTAWKHGAKESGDIMLSALCPYILEMYEIWGDMLGRSLSDVFQATLYFNSPLRLPGELCEQILFFYNHGLRVRIGNYMTMGGTGPVTLAGCLALNLAERVAIAILERVLYGDYRWELYGELVPLDMATLVLQETRLEMMLVNLAVIHQARYYGVNAHPFAGYHTNARLPSPEASMEKLVGALPCILAGGGHLKVGRLASGSSPIQMLLDSELVNAVRHILRGFAVDEDRLGAHLIDQVGPGGVFTGTEHTVRHMRSEFWQPSRWLRMAREARGGEEKTEVERALEVWRDLVSQPDPEPALSEETERRLQAVIDRAAGRF